MADIIELFPGDGDPLPGDPAPFPGDADPHAFLNSVRGHFIVARALDLAIRYIDQLPEKRKPYSERTEMRFILDNCFAGLARAFDESEQLAGQDGPPDEPD